MASVEQKKPQVLTLPQALDLIDRLSDHNVAFADQAERLEMENKQLRKQLAATEERHQTEIDALEEMLAEDAYIFEERFRALERRAKEVKEQIRCLSR